MNLEDEKNLEHFLSFANEKQKIKNTQFLEHYPKHDFKDKILGISMNDIKNFMHLSPQMEISTVLKLTQSIYNETRMLGWAMLIRDYSEISILKYFMLHESKNCLNANIVDFAAPLCSKMLIKRESLKDTEKVGYSILFNAQNIWEVRFSLMMSIPMIKKENLNYPMDILNRAISFDDPIVEQSCGIILNEVKKVNHNVVKYFIEDNKLSDTIINEIK